MKIRVFPILLLLLCIALPNSAQDIKAERILHHNMLKKVKNDVEKYYYDAKFNGVDVEGNFKKATKLIDKSETSEEMSSVISRFLLQFNDSHVYFLPPKKTVSVDYGWELMLFDEKAYVTEIDEESNAYKKGVRIGDHIYMIQGFIPTRNNFSTLKHHFEVLNPQANLEIYLVKPSGNKYRLTIEASIIRDNVFMPSSRELTLEYQKEERERHKLSYYQEIPKLTILKMSSFGITPTQTNKMMDKIKDGNDLILDLRENRGGLLASLGQLLNNFFPEEITICKVVERDGVKKYVTEPRSKKSIFSGKLIVLIGNNSASAAELFAKIIQIEKRGKVIGDQSSGAVMISKKYLHTFGLDSLIPYGASITIADLIMKDGKRLEKVGVTPDIKIVPTQLDLVNKRDPVLANATRMLGFEMTPVEAGRIFSKD